MSDLSNNVWDTLKQSVPTLTGALADRIRTRAAPSGNVRYSTSQNPGFGSQGAYPQAEAKPNPGGQGTLTNLFSPKALIVAAVVLVAVLVLRHR